MGNLSCSHFRTSVRLLLRSGLWIYRAGCQIRDEPHQLADRYTDFGCPIDPTCRTLDCWRVAGQVQRAVCCRHWYPDRWGLTVQRCAGQLLH